MDGLRHLLAPLAASRRALWPLALALLLTYGYFIGTPAWNQNSRFALTRALVEHQTVIIDAYHETTGDKSRRDGHFYSDKAPGASFLAVPTYALFYGAKQLTGGELPDAEVFPLDPLDAAAQRIPSPEQRRPGDRLVYNKAHRVALYLCTLTTTSLVAVLGLLAFHLLALQGTAGNRRAALVVTLAYGLATPAFPYSTVFYGHQLCAAFLLIGFALIWLAPRQLRRGAAIPVLAGSAAGLAVTCEYPAAIPVILLLVLASWRHDWRFCGWMMLGGLPWAVALGVYHTAAFGHPLSTGYDHVYLPEFAAGMRDNYGLGLPDPAVLLQLLFGSYRGLFYLSPLLLLAVWGLLAWASGAWRERRTLGTSAAICAVAIVGYYLVLNSGYYMWDGGSSLGPRHLVPMLPFLSLGLVPAFRAVPLAWWVLGGLSLVQMLLGTAAAPEVPQHGNPLWGYAVAKVLSTGTSTDLGATNLGRLLGLPGVWSLVPLLALWGWVWPWIEEELGTEDQNRTATPPPQRPPS